MNRFLDREYVRRLADTSLRLYAHNLLHFGPLVGRSSPHWRDPGMRPHRINVVRLSPISVGSTAFCLRVLPSTLALPLSIAQSITSFPMPPARSRVVFISGFLQRGPMGLARPRMVMSRIRVRVPKRAIVPLSVDEVARFLGELPYRSRLSHCWLDAVARAPLGGGADPESR